MTRALVLIPLHPHVGMPREQVGWQLQTTNTTTTTAAAAAATTTTKSASPGADTPSCMCQILQMLLL